MTRGMGIVCAGALLVATAGGCSVGSFLLNFTGPGGKPQVVAGSVGQVSTRLQVALGNVGILATLSRQGQDARLVGVTKSGKKFALILKQQQTEAGEKTAIFAEWQDEPDEAFWLTVLQFLTAPAADAPADASRTSRPATFGGMPN
jgi:hypothetical protein